MDKSVKKRWQEEYDDLKKVMKKIFMPKKEKTLSQLVLQPIRPKNNQG
jgi:hypothetical protein